MKQIESCFLCGGRDFQFLFKNYDRMHGLRGEFSLYRCSCGLVFINPQPDEREIASFYPEAYGAYQEQDTTSSDHFLKRFLEKIYYKVQGERLKKIIFLPLRPLLRSTKIKKNGYLLDVGCGEGDFLDKMKKCGMEVHGVDFSEVAVSRARARGLNVVRGTLIEAHFPNAYFDVITVNHVFEHLHDPVEFLIEAKRILKSEGVIILGTPNIASLGFRVFGRFWMPLETPRHLFLYSIKTISLLSEKVGLKVTGRSFQSYPWYFLFSFHYWMNQFRRKEILGMNARLPSNTFLKLSSFPATTLLSWTPWADCLEIWLEKTRE